MGARSSWETQGQKATLNISTRRGPDPARSRVFWARTLDGPRTGPRGPGRVRVRASHGALGTKRGAFGTRPATNRRGACGVQPPSRVAPPVVGAGACTEWKTVGNRRVEADPESLWSCYSLGTTFQDGSTSRGSSFSPREKVRRLRGL